MYIYRERDRETETDREHLFVILEYAFAVCKTSHVREMNGK